MFRVIHELNTRLWLREWSQRMGRSLTLATLPEAALDEIHGDAAWLMGVWQPSARGAEIARMHPGLRQDYRRALDTLSDDDVGSSPYAIAGYSVSAQLGGDSALAELRDRLRARNIQLVLDFVPNHLAVDHPWGTLRPELFVHGTRDAYIAAPDAFHITRKGAILACGKDPYFPSWTDTLQLNYAHPDTRALMRDVLVQLASQCDGVRCDMAMLVLREVFNRTWSSLHVHMEDEFWPGAISDVKKAFPNFQMLAEVYWDREWELMQMGFDGCYDKRLYDRLSRRDITGVRDHLRAEMVFQSHLIRFTENHDEHRAAAHFAGFHRAATLIAATSPGMFLLHEGQDRGWHRKVPVQLLRREPEPADRATEQFHARLQPLLHHPAITHGDMQVLDMHGGVIAFLRRHGAERALTLVNLGTQQALVQVPHEVWPTPPHWDALRILSTEDARSPHLTLTPQGMHASLLPGEGWCVVASSASRT